LNVSRSGDRPAVRPERPSLSRAPAPWAARVGFRPDQDGPLRNGEFPAMGGTSLVPLRWINCRSAQRAWASGWCRLDHL